MLQLLGGAPQDDNTGRPEQGQQQAIVQYNIVFDDEAQQVAWFAFIKTLKVKYPETETLGARLALHIKANGNGAA